MYIREKKIRSFTFLCLLMTIWSVKAQTISIKLQAKGFSNEQLATKKITDTNNFKNVPTLNYVSWSLRKVAYNPVQAIYENVIDQKITKQQFRTFVINNKLDTTFLIPQKLDKNYIYIFTGLDTNGLKHVIVDTNNNRDFSDDKQYTFNLKSIVKNYPEFETLITYFDGYSVKEGKVPLKLDVYTTVFPDNSYANLEEKNLDVTIIKLYQNMYGKTTIAGSNYHINVINHNNIYKKASFNIEVEKINMDNSSQNSVIYSSKDTLHFGYENYKFYKLDDSILILKYLNKENTAGAEINTRAPSIIGNELISMKSFSLESYKEKYVIIDFWGSWCIPCIQLLPELKNYYELYKNEIEFLSIAFDKPQNQSKLKELIKANDMVWHHMFDDMDKGEITKKYRVQQFPTTILIAPNGKVVFRSTGQSGLQDLIKYLNNIGIISK